MFKVISSEFKKMFSKPGIYILAILLAVILVLGVLVYNPNLYETNKLTLEGDNFMQKYSYFMGESSSSGVKNKIDNSVDSIISQVQQYSIKGDERSSLKNTITSLNENVNEIFKEYVDCSIDGLNSTIDTTRTNLKISLENLNKVIINANTNASQGCYALLMSEKTYADYTSLYKDIIDWVEIKEYNKDRLSNHCHNFKTEFQPKLNKVLNNFIYPELTEEFIANYSTYSEGTKLHTLNSRLEIIMIKIEDAKKEASQSIEMSNKLTNEMTLLAIDYANTADTFVNLVKYELISHAFNYLSTTDKMEIMHLNKISEYNSNSLKIRYSYLFDNNASENEYAHPLTIGITSNNDINAYDYAYFVLRLFSFVIVAYAVMAACHSIAGEIKEGSMRYLAIRPVSRKQVLFGKFLSIIITASILAIFSSILAICVGGAVYGFESLNILTIFNGSLAFTIHPIGMVVIFVISMLLEVIVYTSIAMLLSTLIKSDLLSVTIILVIYLINTLIPVFINDINSWLAFYPFSHINLYSLFGSSIYATSTDFFNVLLGTKIYASTNLILTIIVTLALIIVPNIIAAKIFKNKEL